MNIRTTVRMTLWLIVANFVTYVLAESTNQTLFTWLGMGFSIWLFLNLYWLGIGFIAYLSKVERENQVATSIDEAASLVENTLAAPYESMMSTPQSQSLQQTTLE